MVWRRILFRYGRKKYTLVKSFSCALTGGAAVLIGCILYAVCIYIYCPHISSYTEAQISQFYLSHSLYTGSVFLEWCSMLLNLVMVTAIFAQVDLIFVVIFRKKFLSLTFPMILQYLSERLTDLWNGQLWKIYLENGNLDFFNRYSSFVMFLPSNQLSMYSTFPYHTNLSVAVYYMILLLVFFVLVFIFHMLLERRVVHYA